MSYQRTRPTNSFAQGKQQVVQQQQQQPAPQQAQHSAAEQNAQTEEIVDIWKIAQEKERTLQEEGRNQTRTVVLVGESGSGKSTLLQLLKSGGQNSEDKPKPSSAVEYSYVRRTNVNRKELTNCYEVAGGRQLVELMRMPLVASRDAAALRDAVFVIVTDLSNTKNLVENVAFWIAAVRTQSEKLLAQVFRDKAQEHNSFLYAQIARFETHDDRTRVEPLPLQTIIVGTRYDLYEKFDTEKRKWIARALRFLAHQCGAHLIFSTNQNLQYAASLTTLFNRILFTRSKDLQVLQTDHMKPLQVVSPMDKMAAMALPAQGTANNIKEFQKIIAEGQGGVAKQAGDEQQSGNAPAAKILDDLFSKYSEPKIDSIRAEKDRAMEKENKKLFGNETIAASNAGAQKKQADELVDLGEGEDDYE